jgi:CARDB
MKGFGLGRSSGEPLWRDFIAVASKARPVVTALVLVTLQVFPAEAGPGPVRARVNKINRSVATLHSELRRPTHEINTSKVNKSLADLNSELTSPIYRRALDNINKSWSILDSRLKSGPNHDINNPEIRRWIGEMNKSLASLDSEVERSTQEPIESEEHDSHPHPPHPHHPDSDQPSPHSGSDLLQADLIPIPDPFGWYTCGGRKLKITIKNVGSADAGPTTTEVDFGPHFELLDAAILLTPPLSRGVSTDLTFDIPARCFTPNCSFRIRVDYTNQVNESNETNNTATGNCGG